MNTYVRVETNNNAEGTRGVSHQGDLSFGYFSSAT